MPFDQEPLQPATHPVVSSQQWIAKRKALLAQEKEITRLRDRLVQERRALPWQRVDKPYVFDAPEGRRSLADLFQGRRQLLVQHFMFGPDWEQGCKSCSYMADHMGGMQVHLEHRDISVAAVSRAPLAKIERYRQRMGWTFPWVSSHGNDFNQDFRVSFTPEQMASGSVDSTSACGLSPAKRRPASVCSSATTPARCSVPTPPTVAAWKR